MSSSLSRSRADGARAGAAAAQPARAERRTPHCRRDDCCQRADLGDHRRQEAVALAPSGGRRGARRAGRKRRACRYNYLHRSSPVAIHGAVNGPRPSAPPPISGGLFMTAKRPLQVLDDPLGGDLRHVLVALVHPLSTPIAQGERDRLGQVARIGVRELVVGACPNGNRGRRTKQERCAMTSETLSPIASI
jgi:hypothetical protein